MTLERIRRLAIILDASIVICGDTMTATVYYSDSDRPALTFSLLP